MLVGVINVGQDSQLLPWVQGIPWHRADHELPVGLGVLDARPHLEPPVWQRET